MLDQDVPRLIDMHKQVYTLRPTAPKRCGKVRPSDRRFKLNWRGSTAPGTWIYRVRSRTVIPERRRGGDGRQDAILEAVDEEPGHPDEALRDPSSRVRCRPWLECRPR